MAELPAGRATVAPAGRVAAELEAELLVTALPGDNVPWPLVAAVVRLTLVAVE